MKYIIYLTNLILLKNIASSNQFNDFFNQNTMKLIQKCIDQFIKPIYQLSYSLVISILAIKTIK